MLWALPGGNRSIEPFLPCLSSFPGTFTITIHCCRSCFHFLPLSASHSVISLTYKVASCFLLLTNRLQLQKLKIWELGHNSEVGCLPNAHKAMGSIPSTAYPPNFFFSLWKSKIIPPPVACKCSGEGWDWGWEKSGDPFPWVILCLQDPAYHISFLLDVSGKMKAIPANVSDPIAWCLE